MSLVELASITGASGECKRTPERIREEIAALVEEYHQVAFVDGAKRYEPGVSPVPFGGRVFDADEMRHLVDSSLDFWLTAGRFSRGRSLPQPGMWANCGGGLPVRGVPGSGVVWSMGPPAVRQASARAEGGISTGLMQLSRLLTKMS